MQILVYVATLIPYETYILDFSDIKNWQQNIILQLVYETILTFQVYEIAYVLLNRKANRNT